MYHLTRYLLIFLKDYANYLLVNIKQLHLKEQGRSFIKVARQITFKINVPVFKGFLRL